MRAPHSSDGFTLRRLVRRSNVNPRGGGEEIGGGKELGRVYRKTDPAKEKNESFIEKLHCTPVKMPHSLCIAVCVDKPAVARDIATVRSCEYAIPDALLQPAMRRIQHASEELQAFIAWKYHIVATV